MSQTEVGEVAEAGAGGSSTMPQKRNPVGSALALACARQVHAQAAVLIGALPQEHERALGAWHAEWPALSGALAFAGGAAEAARRALDGLEIDVNRMRSNLELAGGLVMAEQASFLLAEKRPPRGPSSSRRRPNDRGQAAAPCATSSAPTWMRAWTRRTTWALPACSSTAP